MKRLTILACCCVLGTAAAELPAESERIAPYRSYAEFAQQYEFVLNNLDDAIQKAKQDPSVINSHWVCVHGEVLVKEMLHNPQFSQQFEQDSGHSFEAALAHWQNLEARNRQDCARIQAQFDAL